MQRVAVIGGGISGLSTAFYLAKFNPQLNISLFEGNRVGGWIQTIQNSGFVMETGPRSFRVSLRAMPLLGICADIGILDKVLPSYTSSHESLVYSDGEFLNIIPSAPFPLIKALLKFPVYRRTILKNIFGNVNIKSVDPDIDMSIEEFMGKAYKYAKDEDKEFIINTVIDAFQLGIYSGDLKMLSARSCFPISEMFIQKVLAGQPGVKEHADSGHLNTTNMKVIECYHEAKKRRSNAMNFNGGMEILPKALMNYLLTFENFKFIQENAESIESLPTKHKEKAIIHTKKGSFEYDHVISTIPSHQLAKLLNKEKYSELVKNCEKITHNSLIAINLGFEKLNLEGVGYLVPTKENSKISGVLFDSCSFPHLRNSVSIMGKPGYSVDEMVETFRLQTGVKQQHIFMNVNRCEEALPQKNVGHFKIVQNTEKNSPDWLSVSGQSFYPSGIPNCVITAKELAEKLFRSGKLKLFSAK